MFGVGFRDTLIHVNNLAVKSRKKHIKVSRENKNKGFFLNVDLFI